MDRERIKKVAITLTITIILMLIVNYIGRSIDKNKSDSTDNETIELENYEQFKVIQPTVYAALISENTDILSIDNWLFFKSNVEGNGGYKVYDKDNKLIKLAIEKGCNIIIDNNTAVYTDETSSSQSSGNVMWSFLMLIILTFGVGIAVEISRSGEVLPGRSKVVTNTSSENSGSGTQSIKVPTVKFSDVEGVDELKDDIFRLVDCLKNPTKYEKLGARTPKGVILYGPPGTGKTLLAKAIAGEAGVPFISAVGSDFVEKYVGVGAKRIRDLYKKAKQSAPCIVFIDEVDAVAGQRGTDDNTEANQTVNALLAELDGFSSNSRVMTICATNRLDMLDSAFTRAGRFDLKLAVGLPDKDSRVKILKIHSSNKKLDESINLNDLAVKTVGFSGAELEALLNEAALIAAGHNKDMITSSDIDDAFFKLVMKGNKKRRKEINDMHRLVAWHEAGHTLATKILTEDNVTSVTIIGSSSGAGGVTFRNPKDEGLQSKKYLRNLIAVMYAGRAAEELYLGSQELITTGAAQDIKQATSIIKQYLAIYGMGNLGMLDVTQLRPDFTDIVKEASELSKEIYSKILEVLKINKNILDDLALNLLDKETLTEEDIDNIIAKHAVKKEDI